MSTWVAALVAAAAVTATYFFCIRPMRRGSCGMSRDSGSVSSQVAQLREELHALQRENPAAGKRANTVPPVGKEPGPISSAEGGGGDDG